MEFVSFELAKKLKEKGYPQHIADDAYILDNYGEDEYNIGERLPIPLVPNYMDDISAPTISQVLKWLREDKKFNVNMRLYAKDGWYFTVQDYKGEPLYSQLTDTDELYMSYEEAALAGIEYVLDNLIKDEKL